MAIASNVYENLYNNIKNRFTVEGDDGKEYTLGDYMLMKANVKKENANLPVQVVRRDVNAVNAIINYVSEKLTVKTPPVKDKTIKAFPFRTSVAAFLCSALMCTLVFAYGLVALKGISINDGAATTVEAEDVDDTQNDKSENK